LGNKYSQLRTTKAVEPILPHIPHYETPPFFNRHMTRAR
jgi:hypothetical protein